MKLFKKIAKAAGVAARKEKPPDAAASGSYKDPTEAAGPKKEAPVPELKETEGKQTVKGSAPATGAGANAEGTGGQVPSADEEASMRAKYEALSKESEDLKQRNRFLMQMLAVSQLDEAQLEKEIQERQQLLQTSIVTSLGGSCKGSPVYKRI